MSKLRVFWHRRARSSQGHSANTSRDRRCPSVGMIERCKRLARVHLEHSPTGRTPHIGGSHASNDRRTTRGISTTLQVASALPNSVYELRLMPASVSVVNADGARRSRLREGAIGRYGSNTLLLPRHHFFRRFGSEQDIEHPPRETGTQPSEGA